MRKNPKTNPNELSLRIGSGKSIVELRVNSLGSYLRIQKPIGLDWWDCSGSSGKFYVLFSAMDSDPFSECLGFCEKLNSGEFVLNRDRKEVQYFLNLFENGHYNIEVMTCENEWSFVENKVDYNSDPEIRFLWKDEKTKGEFWGSTISNFYFDDHPHFLATQGAEKYDTSRTAYYEKLIQSGKRPVAIIYSGQKDEYRKNSINGKRYVYPTHTALFVLDGHHKLQAYQNLKISPKVLWLRRDIPELNFHSVDYDREIRPRLIRDQKTHFEKNWREFKDS